MRTKSRPVVVVSGAGGSGKTSLVQKLLSYDSDMWFPTSWSTRKPRYAEEDEYKFVSDNEFDRHMQNSGFLEVANVGSYRVGAPTVDGVNVNKLLILILTVDGWLSIRSRFPQHLAFWIHSTDRERRRRLEQRGDSEASIAQRMRLAKLEIQKAQQAGYSHELNNPDGKLNSTVQEAQAYIATFKHNI